jgi:hypothetical protein
LAAKEKCKKKGWAMGQGEREHKTIQRGDLGASKGDLTISQ